MAFTPKTWVNGNILDATALVDMETRLSNYTERARAGAIYPEDYGAVGGGSGVDDTIAVQAACDYAAANFSRHPLVYLANGPYNVKEVLVGAYTGLEGPMMSLVSLVRLPGYTPVGPLVREKTAAEGNVNGASGIWIRNLAIRGNGASGDHGFSIGNNGNTNLTLNFLSSIQNCHARGFGGLGFDINQNAAHCSYLWSVSNDTGIRTYGECNHYGPMWAEGNATANFIIRDSYSTFEALHTEGQGTIQHVNIQGGQNLFMGMSCIWGSSNADKLVIISNAGNIIHGARFHSNPIGSQTFNHGIYYTTWGVGTGTQSQVPFWIDTSAQANWPGFLFDSFDGFQTKLSALQYQSAGSITPVRTSTTTRAAATLGNRLHPTTAGNGAMLYDITLQQPVWSDGTNWRTADGTIA